MSFKLFPGVAVWLNGGALVIDSDSSDPEDKALRVSGDASIDGDVSVNELSYTSLSLGSRTTTLLSAAGSSTTLVPIGTYYALSYEGTTLEIQDSLSNWQDIGTPSLIISDGVNVRVVNTGATTNVFLVKISE